MSLFDLMGLWQTMLARLEYRLSLPTVWSFLKRFCKAAGRSVDKPDDFFQLVSYLIELSMIQVRLPRKCLALSFVYYPARATPLFKRAVLKMWTL